MRLEKSTMVATILILLLSAVGLAQDESPQRTLIANVNLWDGMADDFVPGVNVLIEDEVFVQISAVAIAADDAVVIDGNPLTDITMVRPEHIVTVIKGGTTYDPLGK